MGAVKSKFLPRNISKYKGDYKNITARSNMERTVMNFLDLHTDCLEWGSETVVIPYRSPLDGRMHRYFVDFYVKFKLPNGGFKEMLIEVKPAKESQPPVKKGRMTARYIREVKKWGVNSAKWTAATAFAQKRGWEFVVFTEKDIKQIGDM